ncbi:YscG family type III secretion system chaperone [Aeromonas diversa]|uniref:YscG family type III secretion system chaperone n=1 Tax=Aeromonas diversa TaxID=502790 RepID=UPI003462BFF4
MMNIPLKKQLAELALAGTGHHCHQEAASIADWLAHEASMAECVTLIRLSSLMNQGDYQGALSLGRPQSSPDIEPWLALCEWRLDMRDELAARLARLEASGQPSLQQFAAGLREQMAS